MEDLTRHTEHEPDTPLRGLAQALNDVDWARSPECLRTVAWQHALPTLLRHGLLPAVAQRLRATPAWLALDPPTRATLEQASQALAVREIAHRAALEVVAPTMAQHGIRTLVIKGEALARTHFPRPALRERGDIDLWVNDTDFDAAAQVLTALGWRARVGADGTWSLPERSFDGPNGAVIDLHRRLFSQPLLARALGFDQVWQAALPLDAARAPDPAHALLIAALHRIAHHTEQLDRWIWLWDVHVLVQRNVPCLIAAAQQARAAGVGALLAHTLHDCVHVFATPIEPAIVEELAACAPDERSARLLQPMGAKRRLLFDIHSAPNARAAWTLLGETLFPRREYMQARFGPGWLPWLYVRRAWRGLRKTSQRR